MLSPVPMAVIATTALAFSPTFGARVRFLLMCLVCLVSMAMSGMLTHAATPLAAAALVWLRLRGRIPIVLVAVVASILLILQPVKSHYRAIRWGNESRVGIVDAWGEAFADTASLGRLTQGGQEARSRFSELDVLAYTVELVPRAVPHSGGRAYEIALMSFIPRLVWPDKPNLSTVGTDTFTIPLRLPDARTRGAVGDRPIGAPSRLPRTWCAGRARMGSALVGMAFGLIVRFFWPCPRGRGCGANGWRSHGIRHQWGLRLLLFGCVVQTLLGTLMLLWLLRALSRVQEIRPVARVG